MHKPNQLPLSPTQLTVIHALATGSDVTTAAAAALREAKANHVEALQDQLRNLTNSAVATLRAILENGAASDANRLRAALAVIRAVEATHPNRDIPAMGDFERFMNAGFQTGHEQAALSHTLAATPRNAPCPCGSGAKFKRCCGSQAPPSLHNSSQFITSGGFSQ